MVLTLEWWKINPSQTSSKSKRSNLKEKTSRQPLKGPEPKEMNKIITYHSWNIIQKKILQSQSILWVSSGPKNNTDQSPTKYGENTFDFDILIPSV